MSLHVCCNIQAVASEFSINRDVGHLAMAGAVYVKCREYFLGLTDQKSTEVSTLTWFFPY